MSHISYSELKDWAYCPYYHKLTRVDGIDGFLVGNASLDPKEFANVALSLE